MAAVERPRTLQSAEDRRLSPCTGWTRAHWLETLGWLVDGLDAVASPGRARLAFPGPVSHNGRDADELEGYARTFAMSAPWLYRASSPVLRTPSRDVDLAAFYRQGLLNGTDPASPEYWGPIADLSQPLVETASIAWALWLSRRHVWNTLSRAERDQVARYLSQCRGKKYHANNWRLCGAIVNAFLKVEGYEHSAEELRSHLDSVESGYLGRGWYRDGRGQISYYAAWAFHHYLPIWCLIDGDSDPARAARVRERLAEFTESFRLFFAADGSYPAFGRSAIYRFAVAVPFVMAHVLGQSALPAGESRRLCSGILRWFVEQGAIDGEDHLSLGFTVPNESAVEFYSCGASPYWAAKAFTAFLLPESHDFWTAVEEPLVVETRDYSEAIPEAGLLVMGERATGHVQIVSQMSFHPRADFAKKYTSLAYSSLFSYESRDTPGRPGCDNSLVYTDDGQRFHRRIAITHVGCCPGFNAATFALFPDDPESIAWSAVVVKDGGFVTLHRIRTRRALVYYEGGYALGYDQGQPRLVEGPDWLLAGAQGKSSFIRRLHGYDSLVPPAPMPEGEPATNLRHRWSVVPAVARRGGGTGEIVLAAFVCGHPRDCKGEDLVRVVADLRVEGARVFLTFADGEEVFVQLAPVENVGLTMNGKRLEGDILHARVGPGGRAWRILHGDRREECHG